MTDKHSMNYSTYPDDKRDRHGALRNTQAADWAHRRFASYSGVQYGLAASLVPYVSDDDKPLTREQFLRVIVMRIEDDLKYKTF
jgi:hypothetical protein